LDQAGFGLEDFNDVNAFNKAIQYRHESVTQRF